MPNFMCCSAKAIRIRGSPVARRGARGGICYCPLTQRLLQQLDPLARLRSLHAAAGKLCSVGLLDVRWEIGGR